MPFAIPAVIHYSTLPATLGAELASAADLARLEKADATRRAYGSDWRIFKSYCEERGALALPAAPVTVAAFLAWEDGRDSKPSTIGRRVAAVLYAHKLASLTSPTNDERVKAVMRGIRRKQGVAPVKKAPADSVMVLAMCANVGTGLASLRDRALLLLGFSIAARRSELVALDVADIVENEHGLMVRIRRSKTDQEGHGATVAVPFGAIACPVKALRAWLDAAGITNGPIFRPVRTGGSVAATRLTGRSVASIVKVHAKRLGLDPAAFAGHSLRAGFATSAASRGANLFKIMDVTRHKSVDTLRGYVRDAELFRNHAGDGML
jgi:site-specific recombinase XerD